MSDYLSWLPSVLGALIGAFMTLVLLSLGLLFLWLIAQALRGDYFRLRAWWRVAGLVQSMLTARRSRAVICSALLLRRWSKGVQFWPSRLAYRLLGGVTPEEREAVETRLILIDALLSVRRDANAGKASAQPSFAATWSSTFPRWKACVLLFVGISIVTVFVPPRFAWGAFCLASVFVGWKRRDHSFSEWANAIRLALVGTFAGTLLWSLVAAPLQRDGIIRLSRDLNIKVPEWFLCCIWDDR